MKTGKNQGSWDFSDIGIYIRIFTANKIRDDDEVQVDSVIVEGAWCQLKDSENTSYNPAAVNFSEAL